MQIDGKANVVYFEGTAQFIIEKSIKEMKDNTSECKRIVKMAAKLIKSEIKCNVEEYPSIEDVELLENKIVPLLRLFMKELNSDELKQSPVGQAMTKAVRLRSYIATLMFGLGIELAFSISPTEVTRFKHSVSTSKENDV